MIEPAFMGIESCMVLAGPPCSVTGWLKDFTDQGRVTEVPITSMVIKARQQTNTGRPTLRRVISLRVTNSPLGEKVEIGRLNFTAIATEIGIAHVVGKNKNKVWSLG
jgi:hypothetical protein